MGTRQCGRLTCMESLLNEERRTKNEEIQIMKTKAIYTLSAVTHCHGRKREARCPKRGFRTQNFAKDLPALILAAVLSLTACVKDDLYDTPHPDKGAIVVQVDWSDLMPEAVPDSYVINVDGEEQTVSGTTNTVDKLAEPGEHTLLIYNRPTGISISGDVASVNEAAASRAETVSVNIEPLPDYLFSFFTTIDVQADDTLRIQTKPVQHIRQVEMELSVTEGDHERVASVRGTFSGVERSVNLRTGEHPGTVSQTHTAFALDGCKYTASFRLMGIVPSKAQTLTVDITFSNGDTQQVVSDLSQQMAGFNDGVQPIRLTGNLRLPVEGSFSGSIESWQQADGGNTDAH